MKGSFAPVALNTPSTVYTNTSTSDTSYTFYVNCSNMLSGDIISVALKTDVTTTEATVMVDTINFADLAGQTAVVSIPIIQESGDIFSVILEQTAGTVKTYEWGVVDVKY